MKIKPMPVAIAVIVITLNNLQVANAQIMDYCNNPRYDTANVFSEAQLQTTDVVFGYNTDWKGKRDTLHLLLYYPGSQVDTFSKRPLMVLIHGGGFLKGSYSGEKDNEKYFAKKGYVVASIDYRLGWNDQCIANNLTVTDAIYRGMQDAKAALRYLVANASTYKIDISNIFLYGQSAGAVTSLMIRFVDESEFNSKFPGTSDRLGHLDNATNALTNTFSIAAIASKSGGIFDTSFINTKVQTPVLMFHGTADSTVPFGTGYPFRCVYDPLMQGSQEIRMRLNTLGEIYELDYQVGAGHGNVYETEDSFFYHRVSHFFKRILCKKFKEIIFDDKTIVQNSSSPCNTLYAILKSKTNVSCTAGSDGSIIAGKSGGTSPYQYQLNDGVYQTSNTFNNLSAGIYTATVKDGRNCTASIFPKIADGTVHCIVSTQTQGSISEVSSRFNVKIYPNPSSSMFTLTAEGKRSFKIQVTDIYGRTVLRSKEIENGYYVFGENFTQGIYLVSILQGSNIKTITIIKGNGGNH